MIKTGIRAYVFNLLSGLVGFQAYAAIIGILFLCGLGAPIPEDVTLLAAGFIASNKNISLHGAIIAGFIGVLAGDTLLYTLGRLFGRRAFQLPGLRRLFTPARIDLAQKQIRAHRKVICFMARFLPGLRAPVYLTVGVMHVSFWSFFLLDGLAAMISVPVWVYIGHFFGQNLDVAWKKLHDLQIFLIPLGIAVAGFVIWRVVVTHRKEKAAALKIGATDPAPQTGPTDPVP